MQIYIYIYTYIHIHTYTYTYIHIYTLIGETVLHEESAELFRRRNLSMCIAGRIAQLFFRNTYMHMYTRICTYIHIHTYKYTYIYAQMGIAPLQVAALLQRRYIFSSGSGSAATFCQLYRLAVAPLQICSSAGWFSATALLALLFFSTKLKI